MSLTLNFTEVSLCFCGLAIFLCVFWLTGLCVEMFLLSSEAVRVSKLREVVGVPILKWSGTGYKLVSTEVIYRHREVS